MSINKDTALKTLLACETADLDILDHIGYDLWEIIDRLFLSGVRPTLDAIIREVFYKGAEELEQEINDRICELEAIPNERDLDDGEETELVALQELDAQKDIRWRCGGLKTRIWFEKNEEIYREYLNGEIRSIEKNTGFPFLTQDITSGILPLTIDELQKMNDADVWIVFPAGADGSRRIMHALVESDRDSGNVWLTNSLGGRTIFDNLNEAGAAICRKKPQVL